jgi:tocopherol cyclase
MIRWVWAVGFAWFLSACSGTETELPWPTDLPANPEDGDHFDGESDPYYEGWYHKISLPEEEDAFFFIYTVINPLPGSTFPSEAFLYCGRSKTLETVYQSFPATAYSAENEHRDVRILDGDRQVARATALRFAGEAREGSAECSWDVWLDDGVPWTETMGWLTGQPGLETSWTVGTIRARASGWIRFKGEKFTFEDVPGYCDHNWGVVFPREWIWMQANSFPGSNAALAASGGTVDFGETEIEAFMIGLLLDDEVIAFRTQDFHTVEAVADKGHWSITGEDELKRITIEAQCDPATMFHLLAPTTTGMQPRAWESLVGTVEVTLETRPDLLSDWQVTFQRTSPWAGVEIGD